MNLLNYFHSFIAYFIAAFQISLILYVLFAVITRKNFRLLLRFTY